MSMPMPATLPTSARRRRRPETPRHAAIRVYHSHCGDHLTLTLPDVLSIARAAVQADRKCRRMAKARPN